MHDALPPLSLYIHIPWCVEKCPYCDFNSHRKGDLFDEGAYVDALLRDLDFELGRVGGRELSSIFIGGGTPSLFSVPAMTRLMSGVAGRLPFSDEMEVSLEANPGTVEAGRFEGYQEAGINRLSIGVQSFQADSLSRLGRIHGPDEAVRAVESAIRAGFDNFNLDLMFGLPGQTLEMAGDDVRIALEMGPSHISYYQLTLEPNTRFFHRPPALPDADQVWDIQAQGHELLAAGGFGQYEVSAFSLPGRRCRHNLNYWEFGDYLGIGAGAHGKLTMPDPWEIQRRWRVRSPGDYLRYAGSGEALAGRRIVQRDELVMEFMMNALRCVEGFDFVLFTERTGLASDLLAPMLVNPRDKGLIIVSEGRIRTTDLGWRYLDDLLTCFCVDG